MLLRLLRTVTARVVCFRLSWWVWWFLVTTAWKRCGFVACLWPTCWWTEPASASCCWSYPAAADAARRNELKEQKHRNDPDYTAVDHSPHSNEWNLSKACFVGFIAGVSYPELLWGRRGVWSVHHQGRVRTLSAELAGFQCSARENRNISPQTCTTVQRWRANSCQCSKQLQEELPGEPPRNDSKVKEDEVYTSHIQQIMVTFLIIRIVHQPLQGQQAV